MHLTRFTLSIHSSFQGSFHLLIQTELDFILIVTTRVINGNNSKLRLILLLYIKVFLNVY